MPSPTSWRIFSVTSCSASTSRAHSSARSTRSSVSVASSSSTLRSVGMSDHAPKPSASAPGSVVVRSSSGRRRDRRRSASTESTARSSRPSSSARGDATSSVTSCASTHSAVPVPATPVPRTARCRPRMIAAARPLGSSPDSSTTATVPTRAYRPSMRGTSRSRPSPSFAATTAARASSVSSVRVATVLGSTTPVARGSTGNAWVSVSSGIGLRSRLHDYVTGGTDPRALLFPTWAPVFGPDDAGRAGPGASPGSAPRSRRPAPGPRASRSG